VSKFLVRDVENREEGRGESNEALRGAISPIKLLPSLPCVGDDNIGDWKEVARAKLLPANSKTFPKHKH
jgi:hypothetical protein